MLFQVSFACFISPIIEVILAQVYLELYYLANTGPKGYFRLVVQSVTSVKWFLRTCSVWSS